MLAFVSKDAVLHAQPRQGQVGPVQQGHALGTLLLDGFGQAVVLAGVLGGFVLSPGFFQVGPHLAVGLLNVPDGGFQLGGGFVLQLGDGLSCSFPLIEQLGVLGVQFICQLLQCGNAFPGALQLVHTLLHLLFKLCILGPQALVLAIPGQNVLLLADELGGAHRLVRGFRVGDHFLGKVLFLGGQLTGEGALVVQALDLHVLDVQFRAHADDAQQDVSLFLVAGVHEAGQVEGQRLHKGVEQLLAAAAARGVGDGQAGIFALALHHHAVGQCDLEVSRSDSTVPLCGVRTETVPAQGPRQGVQHTGLALIVVAAHESEPGGRRRKGHRLDTLDIFGLKGRNGYRHLDTSPWICPSV